MSRPETGFEQSPSNHYKKMLAKEITVEEYVELLRDDVDRRLGLGAYKQTLEQPETAGQPIQLSLGQRVLKLIQKTK